MLIEYHRTMLADKTRNDAFYAALKGIIDKKKTTVADIGAGTGLLGFLAEKLGAKHVFMFESASIVGVAQKLARANGMKNCHFFDAHSTEVTGLPPVDVVVSETLGNYAFEENIIATMNDAKRFLKPGGTVIPQSVTHFACPVTNDRFYKELTAWDNVGRGLDYGLAKTMGLNNVYVRRFAAKDLLDGGKAACMWDSVDFRKVNSSNRRGAARWTMKRAATITGLAVWWESLLAPGLALSTAPGAPRTHWEQLYFPVLTPVKVKKGDTLSVTLASRSTYEDGTNLSWSVALNGKNRQAMDLRKGYLA